MVMGKSKENRRNEINEWLMFDSDKTKGMWDEIGTVGWSIYYNGINECVYYKG